MSKPKTRNLDSIDSIVVHCSASPFGDVDLIRQWHLERNMWDIGYNRVITNGRLHSKAKYDEKLDGLIQIGRDLKFEGAHCRGLNVTSIGICLIGTHYFTAKQFQHLYLLISDLRREFDIPATSVFCHNEYSDKTCPNFTPEFLQTLVEGRL